MYICPKCNKEVDTTIIDKKQEFNIRDLNIIVNSKIRVCKNCGEELIDIELDDIAFKKAYDMYKKEKGLLTSDEIKSIREKYGLSQKQLAVLLGMGEKTITRYENGPIQDYTHDNILRMINNDTMFLFIWNLRKNLLTEKEIEKIEKNYKERFGVTICNLHTN